MSNLTRDDLRMIKHLAFVHQNRLKEIMGESEDLGENYQQLLEQCQRIIDGASDTINYSGVYTRFEFYPIYSND